MFSSYHVHVGFSVGRAFQKSVCEIPAGRISMNMLFAFDLNRGEYTLPSTIEYVKQYAKDQSVDDIELSKCCELLSYFLLVMEREAPLRASDRKIDGTFKPKLSFEAYKKGGNESSSEDEGSDAPAYEITFPGLW